MTRSGDGGADGWTDGEDDAPVDFRERVELGFSRIPFRVKVGVVWFAIFAVLAVFFALAAYDVEWMRENFTFILTGVRYTLLLAVGGIVLDIVLAVLGALARLSHNSVAYGVAGFYV